MIICNEDFEISKTTCNKNDVAYEYEKEQDKNSRLSKIHIW